MVKGHPALNFPTQGRKTESTQINTLRPLPLSRAQSHPNQVILPGKCSKTAGGSPTAFLTQSVAEIHISDQFQPHVDLLELTNTIKKIRFFFDPFKQP